jgi:hypothetical protein
VHRNEIRISLLAQWRELIPKVIPRLQLPTICLTMVVVAENQCPPLLVLASSYNAYEKLYK